MTTTAVRASVRRAYDGTVATLVVAALLYGAAGAVVAPLVRTAVAGLGAAQAAGVFAALLAAVALVVLHETGPVWARSVELQWRPPVDVVVARQRAARSAVVGGAALVAGLAAVVAARAGSPVLPVAVVGGTVVLLAGVAALACQRLDRVGWLPTASAVCGVVGAALVCRAGGPVPVAFLATSAAYALALARARPRPMPSRLRLHAVPPRWELVRAGESVESLRTSTVMLDGAARALLRDTRLPPQRRPLRVHGGLLVVARTLTSWRVAVAVPLLAVPAGVVAVWGVATGAAALELAVVLLGVRCARNLETYLDSAALRRAFALPGRRPGWMLACSAGAIVAVGALVACALAGLDLTWAAVAVGLTALVVLRRLSGRRLAGRVGALVSTPAGGIPLDLAQRVLAGPDVVAVGVLVSVALAPGVAFVAVAVALVSYALAVTARGR